MSVVVATAVVGFGVVALVEPGRDPVLDQLLADPMAATTQPGAVAIVVANDEAKSGNWISSKPNSSRVLRSYRPVNGTPEALATALVERASSAGWTFDSSHTAATKHFAFGEGDLSILVNRYVDPAEVVVTLEPAGG